MGALLSASAQAANPGAQGGDFISPYGSLLVAGACLLCFTAGVLRGFGRHAWERRVGGLALLILGSAQFVDYALASSAAKGATSFSLEVATSKAIWLCGIGLITQYGVALVVELFRAGGNSMPMNESPRAVPDEPQPTPAPLLSARDIAADAIDAPRGGAMDSAADEGGAVEPRGYRKVSL